MQKLYLKSFNPCFNGTMYKNQLDAVIIMGSLPRFNPCFNGTMYKNNIIGKMMCAPNYCFNPCFNGTMYKNMKLNLPKKKGKKVSILVLMELCIKT